jgi:hypothetical protein
MYFSKFFLILLILSVFSSCKKPAKFPETPELTFTSYTVGQVVDSVLGNVYQNVHLKFSFKDGQGDIGLDQVDTVAPFNYNGMYYNDLFISLFIKKNGEFEFKSTQGSRIPNNLSKYAGKNGLQGYIEIDKRESGAKNTALTVRYDLYIYDRAFHKSNVITSPEISLSF